MIVIPVIDLSNGFAVHARYGQRDTYQRLRSPLCDDGDVPSLVRNLSERFGFLLCYFADLDAISGRGDNRALIEQALGEHPAMQAWVDAGFRSAAGVEQFRGDWRARPVVGTESWQATHPPPRDSVLSIDSLKGRYCDPAGLTQAAPEDLPQDLILMNLDRVGSASGPDLSLLQRWQSQAPGHRCYLAGGVRNARDLEQCAAAGASGVLVASALHDGSLRANDVQRIT